MSDSKIGCTETDWQPYPKFMPEHGKHYLVVSEREDGYRHIHIDFFSEISDTWGSSINCEKVLYWAHPPDFPYEQYDIWSEGYKVTGESGGATYHGTFDGRTFKHACMIFAAGLDKESREYYDPEKNTFWACRLFDNETDARKSFG